MRTKRSLRKTFIISIIFSGLVATCAYASTSEIEMSATINPSATISISANNVALDITPSVEGTFRSDYTTVSTHTNTANNCTVTMTTTSTNLTSGNNTIATLSGSVSEANFTNDRWGYRVGASGDYNAVGASNQIATYAQNTGSSSALNLAVYFAAKLTPATKPGTYTDTVTFISTCAPDPIPIYMQNITQAELLSLMPNIGDETVLYDNRDGKPYMVAHLADGNYWMTQDLDHDIVTTPGFYTYSNTDIGHGSTPNSSATWTASKATYSTGTTTWNGGNTLQRSYDPGDLCWDGEIKSSNAYNLSNATITCGNNEHLHLGNYYSWTAAVAMNDSSSYAQNIDVDQSICPAGWRLPTSGSSYTGSESFKNLWDQYSNRFNAYTIKNPPLYFSYGGMWSGNSIGVGTMNDYWSSVVYSSEYAYMFSSEVGSGAPNPSVLHDRDSGHLVRCVAR